MNKTGFLSLLLLLVFSTVMVYGQFQPGINMNVVKLSQMDNYTTYSNIWGYVDSAGREYVFLGHNAGTSIINITNPANPVEVDMIPGTSPSGGGIIWREMKTFGQYLYIVSEHTSPNSLSGLQIVDLSQLPDTAIYVKRVLWDGVTQANARAHTISIDSAGYITLNGGSATLGAGDNQGGIRFFSLTDPVNPQSVSVFAPRYVHDSFIKDSLLFAHNINEFPGHIDVVNIADRANPRLVTSHIYNNGFSHNSWITEDRKTLISSDEQSGMTVKIWDVSRLWDSNPSNDDSILLVGQYLGAPGTIAHEPRIKHGFCYISHYSEGLKIIDINNPADPVEVGYYDTFTGSGGNFSGAWGAWPYFPSGTIAVSDISGGLFLLNFNNKRAGGVQGVVYEKGTTTPAANVSIRFLEAGKTVTTNAQGSYSLRTAEGTHKLILSRIGFYTDTVTVTISAGANSVQNLYIRNSRVDIQVTADPLTQTQKKDTVSSKLLIIKNTGSFSNLIYTITSEGNSVPALIKNSSTFKKDGYTQTETLPWLQLSKLSGSIGGGISDTIIVSFNSNGLSNDTTYTGTLVITSNDSDEGEVRLPVSLTVQNTPTGINDLTPLTFSVEQNYPNPFNPATSITYAVPLRTHVSLKIFDITGNLIAEPVNAEQNAGIYTVKFDGSRFASGMYIYTFTAGEFTQTRKMILMK